MRSTGPRVLAAGVALATAAVVPAASGGAPASAAPAAPAVTSAVGPPRAPVSIGSGGAVSTVDPYATRIGLEVLRRGGNAVDAAVAAAAALGVTEPYSAGIGGGGYFVYYDPTAKQVFTLDGRETAPAAMRSTSFTDHGTAIPFDEAVTSGLSVGVPGTLATWSTALETWGRRSLAAMLKPSTALARSGFVVDQTFTDQTAANATRFADFPATAKLYLPGGKAPAVGSLQKNPDLADTYDLIATRGLTAFYTGPIATDLVRTVRTPPVAAGTTRPVRRGLMTAKDLAAYAVREQSPTRARHRGLDVYGMAPSSSGGITVAEALNILERQKLSALPRTDQLHRYLEASALAFADRGRYVGDKVIVPTKQLLSQGFADERACQLNPAAALVKPVGPGTPDGSYAPCAAPAAAASLTYEGESTTHLVTADRWGGVVTYTLTIEQTGGSGIVVPGRGFLLNNELTDFSFTDGQNGVDPNLPGPGKRPRSSMSPTLVFRNGSPLLALGSPGGSTIITTVLQVLLGRLEMAMTLPQAIAAPRASQRNTPSVQAEPGFPTEGLAALGHTFTPTPEIGAVAALEFLGKGQVLAAAEPVRRGGGSALVLRSRPRAG